MTRWNERYLGIGEMPAELLDAELEEFFRFARNDVRAITEAFRPKFRLAAALQLGFARMSGGRLNSFKVLPRPLLNFVAEQFEVEAPSITSIRALYRRENTRLEQQAWVMRYLGLKTHTDRQERMLLAAVRSASKGTGSVDRLINVAGQWLHDRNLLIPAYSTLRDICVRASNDSEQAIYLEICKETTEEKRASWMDALLANRRGGRTFLEWLQGAPKRRSPKNLATQFPGGHLKCSIHGHSKCSTPNSHIPGTGCKVLRGGHRLDGTGEGRSVSDNS